MEIATGTGLHPEEMTPRKLGNRRVTGKEQFFTPRSTAEQIVARLVELRTDAPARPWIEPAGGTGTFVDVAQAIGVEQIISYDIEPRHELVRRGNFLQADLTLRGAVAVGNPPFGRNNALSVPFFNHAARYCEIINFIVPRSWRKWSVTNRLDLRFGLIDDYDLTINYLDQNGAQISGRSTLRTCVQTWAVGASTPR